MYEKDYLSDPVSKSKSVVLTGSDVDEAKNAWRCPLTDVAARYTTDRRPDFHINLPAWLARHNKAIFFSLYAVGIIWTLAAWIGARDFSQPSVKALGMQHGNWLYNRLYE